MTDAGGLLQTSANVFAIIAGVAAVATLFLVVVDRRKRIRLGFEIEHREFVAGEGKRHYGVFSVDNRGKGRILILQNYLVLNSKGSRFYDFDNRPGQAAYSLLPEDPPVEAHIRMDRLARALIEAGAIFTAEIDYVVDAGGKPRRRTFVIHDLQQRAKGR